MRPCKIFLFIGAPRTGKTRLIGRILRQSLSKVLVYDVNREKAYARLPYVNVHKLGRFTEGKRRVVCNDPRLVMFSILNEYRNGVLVLDDVDRYLSTLQIQLQSLLVSHRHSGLDIIAVFHSLARVPPVFYETANIIVLKKTSEQPDRAIYKLPNADKVLAGYRMLLNDPDPYKTVYIECR